MAIAKSKIVYVCIYGNKEEKVRLYKTKKGLRVKSYFRWAQSRLRPLTYYHIL